MDRVCSLPLLLLLGSLTAIAQTCQTSADRCLQLKQKALELKQQALAAAVANAHNYCPAGVQVSQQGIARLLYIKTGKTPPPGVEPAVGLHITLSDSRSVGIIGERITVHGYTSGRTEPAVATNGESAGVGKTFDLALKVDPGGEASTDLWAEGFTAITSIDLDTLTYADGSTWRPLDDAQCRILSNIRIGTGR